MDVDKSTSTADSYQLDYVICRRSLDGNEYVIAGFPSLKNAKYHVERTDGDYIDGNYSVIKSPDGEHIWGKDHRIMGKWYTPGETAFVYNWKTDGLTELDKNGFPYVNDNLVPDMDINEYYDYLEM